MTTTKEQRKKKRERKRKEKECHTHKETPNLAITHDICHPSKLSRVPNNDSDNCITDIKNNNVIKYLISFRMKNTSQTPMGNFCHSKKIIKQTMIICDTDIAKHKLKFNVNIVIQKLLITATNHHPIKNFQNLYELPIVLL